MQSACSWGLQDTGSVQSQRYFHNKTPQYKIKSLKFEKKPKMLFFFFIMLIFTSGAKAMVGKTFGPLGRIKTVTPYYTGSYILHHYALKIRISIKF